MAVAKRSRAKGRKVAMRPRKGSRNKRGTKRVTLASRVAALTRQIETKEGQWKTGLNQGLTHNNVNIITAPGNGQAFLNPFTLFVGASDNDQGNGNGQRIGDEITVQSVAFYAFLECALQRPKVYFRFMLVRCAKGDLPTRATLFKGNAGNKMIDEINTERFTIVASKIFNVAASNPIANTTTELTGVPLSAPNIAGDYPGGIGTRIMRVTIPGRKFGRGGVIKYENGLTNQVKFYDYVPLFIVYDWYGTPQDLNTVGRINELYCKIRFKDA